MSSSVNNNYGFPLPIGQSAPKSVISTTAPTTAQWNYPLGQIWINTTSKIAYILAGKASRSGTWVVVSDSSSGITTLTGDTGGAIGPSSGNVNLKGTTNQITVTGSGSTLTWTLSATLVAPGSLTVTSGFTVSAGTTAITGTVNINTSGAGVTSINTGGMGATNIGNATGNTAVTGSLTTSTKLQSTTGGIINAAGAIATTSTSGFMYNASCAGTPTGVPVTVTGSVPFIFDTSTGTGKLWAYIGGSWVGVALS